MVSTLTLYSHICLRPVPSTARFGNVPTAYILKTKSYPLRYTYGISKILPNHILLETVVQNSTKLPR